ncbi:cell surface glycoprotein 1-like isoform X2 [Diprion similis]|uniref:cell surface glycoprotein 1-like isoform X2 n=2 Tax=Diprion similis TaxID=362088 RepID=UPI001EF96D39|nr:cell surface glycoprotein 1-like isoform X2 [Diprion similis]
MGQAWCKERTTKAQDSKSPLDRVFVRCAHQIYPSLKQDGSVLGGATQRVTSSEIGYAGSPPREALTRGQSVDSIDRPFHPSEWVDVNLEVPSTPSSVITNLTANTSVYPTTTLSSTVSNLKHNITPIPPPRRRRKNHGRPLPPKPDEVIVETHKNGKMKKVEPLYSSVKSPKEREALKSKEKILGASESKNTSNNNGESDLKNDNDEEKGNRINDRKANPESKEVDTKRISESTGAEPEDRKAAEELDNEGEHKSNNYRKNDGGIKVGEDVNGKRENSDEEYEKFSKSREMKSSSTPIGSHKETEKESNRHGRNFREFVTQPTVDEDDIMNVVYHRPKNYSTVSLPNYDELEVVKKEVEKNSEEDATPNLVTPKKPDRTRNVSTMSLPIAETVSSLPQEVTERLEKYMTRCRSFGSLQPQEILEKLTAQGEQNESSEEDDWDGLDDWDLGTVEYHDPSDERPPWEPRSRLDKRKAITPKFTVGGSEVVATKKVEARATTAVDVDKQSDLLAVKNETIRTPKLDEKPSAIPRNASFEIPKSPNSLKSALKAEASRKISMPAKLSSEEPSSPLEDWFSAQERSVRFFDAPQLEEEYANTPGHRPVKPSGDRNPEAEYDTKRYPFNGVFPGPLDIDTFFTTPGDFGGTTNSSDVPGPPKVLTRSLSNESEPFEGYEEKELTVDIQSQPSSISKLSRTISDESLPGEMSGINDSHGENTTSKKLRIGDTGSNSRDSKTPPPSPEPKIKVEIFDDDDLPGVRPTSLKISREDEGDSNLSSMTPSLTELEAALSDMLEKADLDEPRPGISDDDHVEDSANSNLRHFEVVGDSTDDKPVEPKILPKPIEGEVDLGPGEESDLFVPRQRKNNGKISLGQILTDGGSQVTSEKVSGKVESESPAGKSSPRRKMAVTPSKNPFEESDEDQEDDVSEASKIPQPGTHPVNPFDTEPPEKPSRLHKIALDQSSPEPADLPTPPQRKNKHGASSPTTKTSPNHADSEFPIRDSAPHPNDRLI